MPLLSLGLDVDQALRDHGAQVGQRLECAFDVAPHPDFAGSSGNGDFADGFHDYLQIVRQRLQRRRAAKVR